MFVMVSGVPEAEAEVGITEPLIGTEVEGAIARTEILLGHYVGSRKGEGTWRLGKEIRERHLTGEWPLLVGKHSTQPWVSGHGRVEDVQTGSQRVS